MNKSIKLRLVGILLTAACSTVLTVSCGQLSAANGGGPVVASAAPAFTQFVFTPVYSVAVGPSGDTWFGTSDGLYFLDNGGTPANAADDTPMRMSSSGPLDFPGIRAMAIDASGGKWLCTFDAGNGLAYFADNGTPRDQSDDDWMVFHTEAFTAIAVDAAGGKWMSTFINPFGSGVRYLDDHGTPSNPTDDTWTAFTTADGLANNSVFGIAVDGSGGTWFATYFGGGASYLDDNGTPTYKGDDTWIRFTTTDGLAKNDLLCVTVDSAGRKWFGSEGGGASCLDDNGTATNKTDDTWTTFTTADGLADDNVESIAFDSSGNVWFGTRNGLSCLDANGTPNNKGDDTWVSFSPPDGIGYPRVGRVAIDNSGNKWLIVATEGPFHQRGGSVVCLTDNGTIDYTADDLYTPIAIGCGLAGNSVTAIAFDSSGGKWIGTGVGGSSSGGVSYFWDGGSPGNSADDQWTVFTTADGLVSNDVTAAAVDRNGTKWFGTSAGLSSLDDDGTPMNRTDDAWTTFTSTDNLASNYVTAIAVDEAGKKWIGTTGGLSYLDDHGTPSNKADDTWQRFTVSEGLVGNNVLAVAIDPSGSKWVGTRNGISCLQDNGTPTNLTDDRVTSFTVANGLANNQVTGIAFDPNGGVWFSTLGGGVSHLNYGSAVGSTSDDVWTSFLSSDGLQADWVNAVAVGSDGAKWFGTTYPSRLRDNGTPSIKSDDAWTKYETWGAPSPVKTISVDASGTEWFGASNGLFCHR